MKFHWGHGITLGIIGFVSFILMMVYLCVQQEFDLVTEDYYQQELQYQQRIDNTENASAFQKEVEWSKDEKALVLNFPEAMMSTLEEGTIQVFRPSDADHDLSIPLSPGEDGIQEIPLSRLIPGLYRLKIEWEKDGKGYYLEKEVYI